MLIAPNIHCVPGVIANVFVLVDPDGLTLVDAGLPYNQRRILAYLQTLGYPPQAVRRILVPHADRDHIGSLAALQARTGARVYASPLEAEALAAGREPRRLRVGAGWRALLWLLGRACSSPAIRCGPWAAACGSPPAPTRPTRRWPRPRPNVNSPCGRA